MAILYLLALAGAAFVLLKSRERGLGARGWPWSGAWALAGALFMFGLLTGLSIGVLVFPAATLAIFWLALSAPYGREVSGFAIGIAAVLLVIVLI